MQDKAHTQAQGKARASRCAQAPHHMHKNWLFVKTNRLTHVPTREWYAPAGANHAHANGTCSASTRDMAPDDLDHWVLLGALYMCRAPLLLCVMHVVTRLMIQTVASRGSPNVFAIQLSHGQIFLGRIHHAGIPFVVHYPVGSALALAVCQSKAFLARAIF